MNHWAVCWVTLKCLECPCVQPTLQIEPPSVQPVLPPSLEQTSWHVSTISTEFAAWFIPILGKHLRRIWSNLCSASNLSLFVHTICSNLTQMMKIGLDAQCTDKKKYGFNHDTCKNPSNAPCSGSRRYVWLFELTDMHEPTQNDKHSKICAKCCKFHDTKRTNSQVVFNGACTENYSTSRNPLWCTVTLRTAFAVMCRANDLIQKQIVSWHNSCVSKSLFWRMGEFCEQTQCPDSQGHGTVMSSWNGDAIAANTCRDQRKVLVRFNGVDLQPWITLNHTVCPNLYLQSTS